MIVIDRTGGGEAPPIAAALRARPRPRVLLQLSRYVQRHKLEARRPVGAVGQHDRWYSDADIAAVPRVRRTAARRGRGSLAVKPARTRPSSTPPNADYEIVAPPAALAGVPDAASTTR